MSNIIGLGFLFLISTKKISYESQTSVGLFINVVVFIGMMVVVGGPSQGSGYYTKLFKKKNNQLKSTKSKLHLVQLWQPSFFQDLIQD